jgi:hypothetical protein
MGASSSKAIEALPTASSLDGADTELLEAFANAVVRVPA